MEQSDSGSRKTTASQDDENCELPSGLQLTPLDAAFRDDPYPILARLREAVALHRDEQLQRWYVTRFEETRQLLRDKQMSSDPRNAAPNSFSARLAANSASAGVGTVGNSILFMDDPDHRRLRALVSRGFAPKAIETLRPRIRAIADQLLAGIGPPEFDLIERFAGPLPVIVIAEMLGVDAGDREQFKQWSDTIVAAFFNPTLQAPQSAVAAQAQREMTAYFARMIAQRRVAAGADLISEMISADESGERMTDEEIITQCNLLLIAGNVTTTDLIGNGVKALLEHPQELALLRANPQLIANAVEEMLRFDSPVTQTGRTVLAETSVSGCPLQRGASITLSLAAANHDPRVNPDPERFDIQRGDIRHQSFGGGKHLCLGAHLARVEAQEAILALLARHPRLALSARGWRYRVVPSFRGLSEFWIEAP
jgi:cytochrome P450